jgi:hypothetical protein
MKNKYIRRKENFFIVLSFYNYININKQFRRNEIIEMYDIDLSTFKIMLQAIREMFEIEYGYINIYYDKTNNKYILIK